MSIFDRFRNLLKKEVSSHEIISFNQLVSIPSREYFRENQEILIQIDAFKDEYKKLLSQFKYLTSLDINSKNLTNNINTNTELLLNIFMTSDEVKRYTVDDKIKYLININKLDLYGNAISNLEIEVIARLIALNELFNERMTFISRNKRNALINEMNNLSGTMLLISNKKLAIELEKKRYLESSIYMVKKIYMLDEEKELVSKKRTFLLNLVRILFPESNFQIRENSEHIFIDMAYLEMMIETYVFNHKNEADILKRQLNVISDSEMSYKDKDKILSSLRLLEYKFLAFYMYGREYIAIEDLMQLYLIKFNVLVLCENGICETFVDANTNDIEFDCYKGIVEREIECFIKGQDEIIDPKIIKVIINILKNGEQTLDAEKILNSKYLLNVLLSMSQKKDLINLLKNFKVKKEKNDYFDFCEEIFEWEEELPLETIYRLMLSQNIGYDAELYECLQSDLYPDKDYYHLPVGLKGINYCTKIAVEQHVLHSATLLSLQKMRKLIDNKYVVCPSTLVYIKNGADFFKNTNIKILFYEGLEISPHDIKDINVIERDKNKITIYNHETNELVTSDLNCYINGKWEAFCAAGLFTHILNRNFFIEEYNADSPFDLSLYKGKNAIKARRNNETKIFSRAYVDISTKFGDFCLHIEEKTKNQYGSYILLSLYHGHHDVIIDDLYNDFNWPKYGIFRTKYMKKNDFYQWMLGYVDTVWSHPFRNIWSYGGTKSKDNKCKAPIYSFSEFQGNGNRGTIFIDGSLKLKDNLEYIPDMFDNLKVNEYENSLYNSKAYFGTPSKHIAVLKYLDSNFIEIIYKQKNKQLGIFEEKSSINIESLSNEEFTYDDFEKIICALDIMPIDSCLKKFVICELQTYISIHYSKNSNFFIRNGSNVEEFPIKLADFLKQENFATLLDLLNSTDANEFVEILIEDITNFFHISINDLLGNPPIEKNKGQKMAETMKRILLSKKHDC